MKKTTAEIRVSVAGPEAEAMARYIKADILSGNADTVERLIISNGELVISLSRPYDGPANVDGYQAFEAAPMTATAKPADEEADDCECSACQLRRLLQAEVDKPTEPAEPTVRLVPVSALSFLAAMMLASKGKE